MALSTGTKLGPYEVLAPLGAGGMGEVWRALDTRLAREVAVKVLPDAVADDARALARFETEAKAVAALSHPNILALYDVGESGGVHYAVTELLEGGTLRDALHDGPLPVRRVLEIATQVTDGLAAAHAKGIVHRDLKPENLFLTASGHLKILDFGLARRVEPKRTGEASSAPTDPQHTEPGMVVGTLAYMSPEQVKGLPADARSDLFSLGAVLHEMLSGRKAFQRDSAVETMAAILKEEPPDLSSAGGSVPPALDRIVRHCLEKSPERRFQSARDVGFALRELSSGVVSDPGEEAVATRRRPVLAVAKAPGRRVLLAAGATLLAATGLVVWLSFRERPGHALPSSKLLAILPATNLTGLPDGRALCDGVSFSLGVKLQTLPGIAVMRPSGPAMLQETDPARWARDTGANLVVQPAVRQMGEMRQLSFSIALTGSSVQVAAGEVTGPAAEHFRLEEELATKLAAALEVHLKTGESVRTPIPAVAAGPAQTAYTVALGYLERWDDRTAVQKAIALLEAFPAGSTSAPVQAALGRAYLAAYKLSKDVSMAGRAREAAQRAVDLAPDLPEARVTLAEVLTATGKSAEAVTILRGVLAHDPRSALALLALVNAFQSARDFAEAREAALRLVALRPTSPTAQNKLGALYFLTSDYEKAAAAFRRAVSLNPQVPGAQQNLGAVLLRLGRFDEARVALEESIRVGPTPTAYSNLGVTQYLLGRNAEAAVAFQHAVELAPKNYRWRIYLGDALSQLPDRAAEAHRAYEAALPLVRAELAVDPSDALTIVLMGRCLARTGEPEKAWAEIGRAVGLAPDDQEVLETAAAAAMLLGKRSEALAWLQKAVARGYGLVEIQRDPDFAPLRTTPEFQKLASLAPAPTTVPETRGEKR